MSHALDVVLKAAGRLRDDTSVRFLFVGEGAEKENLKKLALELKLDNVIFVNEQSRERLLAFYRASDVSLVPLKRLDIFKKVLPSKLFELMGVGCPVICSVEGEAAELVKRSGGGECIEPENVDSLVESIRRLEKNKELRLQMSANGRTFVREFYLRSKLAENYLEALAVAAKLNGRNAAVNCAPGTTGN
ncbi:MAG: glycosyltransferase family 4 protein [Acidobacteria bacterium]|nr:glycosyltransferase family 4 protein [Acidobacteriota bacterium]